MGWLIQFLNSLIPHRPWMHPNPEAGTIILPPNSTGTEVDTVTLGGKDRELIVLSGDGAVGEIAGVVNTQPAETEFGLVTRPITRKDGETLSTAALGISGEFAQAFQDGALDGAIWVEATAAPVGAGADSATGGFKIEESDDTADAAFEVVAAQETVLTGTVISIRAKITRRFWRVRYTNGGTAQTGFRLTATATSVSPLNAAELDYDTDANEIYRVSLLGLALPGSGGPVAGGTSTNPIRVDPTGITTQVVSATLLDIRALTNVDVVTVEQAIAASLKSEVVGPAADGIAVSGNPVRIAGKDGGGLTQDIATDTAGELQVDVLTLPANTSVNLSQVGGTAVVTGGVAGSQGVGGLAADGAALAGNPVLVAGSDGTNARNILVTANGRQIFAAGVAATDGDSNTLAVPFTSSTLSFKSAAALFVFNGTTWDRQRGTTDGLQVIGAVGSGVAVAGNPVLGGLRANQNEPTAVADGQNIFAWGDQQGRQVVVKNFPANVAVDSTNGPKRVALTGTGDVALVPAPGASLSIYITGIGASNSSATKTDVHLKDGTTIRWEWTVAADGGGFFTPFDPPWKLTANTILNGALSTAVTDVNVNVHYFVAP